MRCCSTAGDTAGKQQIDGSERNGRCARAARGGLVGPECGQYVAVGAKASLQRWADIDQCTGTAKKLEEYCESFTECGGGVETDLCSLPNVDHNPYNNSLRFDVAAAAWRMFERQPLR